MKKKRSDYSTAPRGQRHWGAKLGPAEVLDVRQAAREGQRYRHIAACYRISKTQVIRIIRGENWRHISDDFPEERQAFVPWFERRAK